MSACCVITDGQKKSLSSYCPSQFSSKFEPFKIIVASMELPHLGEHCALATCKRLDFLPVKCGGCLKDFCGDHFGYESHSCPQSYLRDVRVPVCPLCDKPIPLRRKGDPPDLLVSQHIDTDCQSDPAKEKRKIFDKKCGMKKCKKKELVQIRCNDCKNNFCLQHRHPQDHQCQGTNPKANALDAAQKREKELQLQKQMKEDEAMARALQASMQSGTETKRMTQEELDRMMALSLANQSDGGTSSSTSSSNKNCTVS